VFIAAEKNPEEELRQAWISSCLDSLRLLESYNYVNDATDSKRPRAASQKDYSEHSNCSKRVKRTKSIMTSKPDHDSLVKETQGAMELFRHTDAIPLERGE
jgi:hypothetical protein